MYEEGIVAIPEGAVVGYIVFVGVVLVTMIDVVGVPDTDEGEIMEWE
jgi:hypothetical protein